MQECVRLPSPSLQAVPPGRDYGDYGVRCRKLSIILVPQDGWYSGVCESEGRAVWLGGAVRCQPHHFPAPGDLFQSACIFHVLPPHTK